MDIIKSGGADCGVSLYCKRVYEHPFTGFEIVLVVWHA